MPKGKGRQDPLGNYIEWENHRYDPGHYLGGTIEPHLRKSSLGPRARRLSGIMLLTIGLMGAALTGVFASEATWVGGLLQSGLYSFLFIAAGVAMWRSTRPAKAAQKPVASSADFRPVNPVRRRSLDTGSEPLDRGPRFLTSFFGRPLNLCAESCEVSSLRKSPSRGKMSGENDELDCSVCRARASCSPVALAKYRVGASQRTASGRSILSYRSSVARGSGFTAELLCGVQCRRQWSPGRHDRWLHGHDKRRCVGYYEER